MMISEKMVFTSSNGNHLVLYARPPAGISIQKCSVRSSFLLNKKASAITANAMINMISAGIRILHYRSMPYVRAAAACPASSSRNCLASAAPPEERKLSDTFSAFLL